MFRYLVLYLHMLQEIECWVQQANKTNSWPRSYFRNMMLNIWKCSNGYLSIPKVYITMEETNENRGIIIIKW